jgi:hypothetical protein
MLGGVIAVSIGVSITTRYLTAHLAEIVPSQLLGSILERTETIHLLKDITAQQTREVFGRAYNLQMYLAIGLAAAQLPTTMLMWTQKTFTQSEKTESHGTDIEH